MIRKPFHGLWAFTGAIGVCIGVVLGRIDTKVGERKHEGKLPDNRQMATTVEQPDNSKQHHDDSSNRKDRGR